MKRQYAVLTVIILVIVCLVAMFGLFDIQDHEIVKADRVSAWQVTTLLTGDQAGYTATSYTTAKYVPNYAHYELHVTSDVSATGVLTITPQFALSTVGCGGTLTRWVDAYAGAGLSGTAISFIVTNDTSRLLLGDIRGVCARVKITSSTSLFTPTIVMRLINK